MKVALYIAAGLFGTCVLFLVVPALIPVPVFLIALSVAAIGWIGVRAARTRQFGILSLAAAVALCALVCASALMPYWWTGDDGSIVIRVVVRDAQTSAAIEGATIELTNLLQRETLISKGATDANGVAEVELPCMLFTKYSIVRTTTDPRLDHVEVTIGARGYWKEHRRLLELPWQAEDAVIVAPVELTRRS